MMSLILVVEPASFAEFATTVVVFAGYILVVDLTPADLPELTDPYVPPVVAFDGFVEPISFHQVSPTTNS